MEDCAKRENKWARVIQAVIAMLGGAVLTMLFNVTELARTNSNDISVIKAQIEPLRDANATLATIKTSSDRNYDMLKDLQNKIDAHMTNDKK